MKYTIEEIYTIVGKDDKTAGLQLIPGTESFKKFGSYITVVFLYTQAEREKMDIMIQAPFTHSGKIKAKYLGWDLKPKPVQLLNDEGVEADDIWDIRYFTASEKNTFHSKEQRTIKKNRIATTYEVKRGRLRLDLRICKKTCKRWYRFESQAASFLSCVKSIF